MAKEPIGAEGWGIALLVAFEVPNLFSGLLPSLFTISTFTDASEEKAAHAKKWIRRGEIQAGVVSLGLGFGGTIVTRSPWPLLLTIMMIVWLGVQYESALRGAASGPRMDMSNQ